MVQRVEELDKVRLPIAFPTLTLPITNLDSIHFRSYKSLLRDASIRARVCVRRLGNTTEILHDFRHYSPECGRPALRIRTIVRHTRGVHRQLQGSCREGAGIFEWRPSESGRGVSPISIFLNSLLQTDPAGVMQESRHAEAPKAPKHRSFSWSNPRSPPVRFGLGTEWGSDWIRRRTS